MSLEKKVRLEFERLPRDEVVQAALEAGFEVIPMKYNAGVFVKYQGSEEGYKTAAAYLSSKGIRVVDRRSAALQDAGEGVR